VSIVLHWKLMQYYSWCQR